jgi:hypothetical protein
VIEQAEEIAEQQIPRGLKPTRDDNSKEHIIPRKIVV